MAGVIGELYNESAGSLEELLAEARRRQNAREAALDAWRAAEAEAVAARLALDDAKVRWWMRFLALMELGPLPEATQRLEVAESRLTLARQEAELTQIAAGLAERRLINARSHK